MNFMDALLKKCSMRMGFARSTDFLRKTLLTAHKRMSAFELHKQALSVRRSAISQVHKYICFVLLRSINAFSFQRDPMDI